MLFNKITDIIEELQDIQQKAEELYVSFEMAAEEAGDSEEEDERMVHTARAGKASASGGRIQPA